MPAPAEPAPSDPASSAHAGVISREEILSRLRDPSLTLVNVLPRVAWEEARIPGSINLPVADIPDRARVDLPDRQAEIALYCASPT